MIRLFAGLPLPDDLCRRLVSLQAGIEGARWVPADNLHLTLRFIGEVAEDRMDDICAALNSVKPETFQITPDGAGRFGTGDRTRAVWVGVSRSPALEALHQRIDTALVRAGFEPEGRKYTPHITVGRLSRARPQHVLGWLEANGAFYFSAFEVNRFALYESHLGRNGPVYGQLTTFALA